MSSTLDRLQRVSFLNVKTQPQDCFALIVPDGPSTLLILPCLKHLRTSVCVSICTLVLKKEKVLRLTNKLILTFGMVPREGLYFC